uniref:Uncharacterized protein n=1 Tax=Arundo donax TaxID=35708 RepID=A0A0A8YEW9_ARUDO
MAILHISSFHNSYASAWT